MAEAGIPGRRPAEAALRQSNERLIAILQSISDGFFALDEDLVVTFFNQAAERMLNRKSADVVGRYLFAAFPEAKGSIFEVEYTRAVREKIQVEFETYFPIPPYQGWYAVRVYPFSNGISVYFQNTTEHKHNAAALIESEAKYRRLFELESDALFLIDNEAGQILDVNAAACSLYGFSRDELLARRNVDLSAEPDQTRAATLQGKTRVPVRYHRKKDGTVFPVEITATHLAVSGRPAHLAAIRDISERLRAEEALRRSEEQFRTLYETMTHGVVYQDSTGSITAANPAAERILGLSLDQMQGRTSLDPGWHTIHPDGSDFPEETHPSKVALHSGKTVTDTVMGVFNPDLGDYRWININAVPLFKPGEQTPHQVYTTFEDITSQKQRERELEAITKVSLALRDAATRAEMLPIILSQAGELLYAGAVALVAYDANTSETYVEAATGAWASATGQRLPEEEGLTSQVIRAGLPYNNPDIRSETRMARLGLIGDLRAMAGVPLFVKDRFLGALWVARDQPVSVEELRILTAIGNLTSSSLHRAGLFAQTRKRLEYLTALRAIDQAIAASMDVRFTLNILIDQVVRQMQVDAACVLLAGQPDHALTYAAGKGFRSNAISLSRIRLGEGLAGKAALEMRIIHQPELQADAAFVRAALLAQEAFVTYFGVPLVSKGRAVGVIELFHREQLHPDQEWFDFLEALAGQAAIAIENAALFEGMQQSNLELSQAYDATIEGWSRAMDLRDHETEGHTLRVTEMTVQLARQMGFSQGELVHVRRGALLHDIGKMGVPDHILFKPGSLAEAEWEIMRQHPLLAFEMLAPIPFLRPALDIPYHHHERWDGSGYPLGLRGEQIPLAARVFAVVDVWDALLSERPYRPAWPPEKVLAFISENAGVLFDPRIVTAFLQMLPAGG